MKMPIAVKDLDKPEHILKDKYKELFEFLKKNKGMAYSVSELVRELQISHSTIYRYLSILLFKRLVKRKRNKQRVYYYYNEKGDDESVEQMS